MWIVIFILWVKAKMMMSILYMMSVTILYLYYLAKIYKSFTNYKLHYKGKVYISYISYISKIIRFYINTLIKGVQASD